MLRSGLCCCPGWTNPTLDALSSTFASSSMCFVKDLNAYHAQKDCTILVCCSRWGWSNWNRVSLFSSSCYCIGSLVSHYFPELQICCSFSHVMFIGVPLKRLHSKKMKAICFIPHSGTFCHASCWHCVIGQAEPQQLMHGNGCKVLAHVP